MRTSWRSGGSNFQYNKNHKMTTLLLIVVALAVAGFLFRDKLKALLTSGASGEAPKQTQLFTYNGFPLASQVLPCNTYVSELGRAPQTLAECRAAGWYLTKTEAKQNGPLPIIAPPFEGTPPSVSELQTFKASVLVKRDGTFIPGSWSPIVVA